MREEAVPGQKFKEACASYSADKLTEKKMRTPFQFNGKMFIGVGGMWGLGSQQEYLEAYQIVPEQAFKGHALWYGEHISFNYHGMKAKKGNEIFVLQGPPVLFKPTDENVRAPKQQNLF